MLRRPAQRGVDLGGDPLDALDEDLRVFCRLGRQPVLLQALGHPFDGGLEE
jgi:hypothetical protein